MTYTSLSSTIHLYRYYKSLGEKAMAQIPDEALFYTPDDKSNSLYVMVKHLHGNMLSRWTDFLTSDGEKEWRDRDGEFVEQHTSRKDVMRMWEEGWARVLSTLEALMPEDLGKIIYIRHQGHTVEEAIMRQLAHYAYHVGQIVYLSRWLNTGDWTSLSIPRGESKAYNQEKFSQPREVKHFTSEK